MNQKKHQNQKKKNISRQPQFSSSPKSAVKIKPELKIEPELLSESASFFSLPPEILTKYAQVLINYALNSGEGVKPNEVVLLNVPDVAKPLAKELHKQVLLAGGQPIVRLLPTGLDFDYYSLANQDQLTFFPTQFWQAQADLIDHQVQILADPDPEELKAVEPGIVLQARDARRAYRDWLNDKENQGHFTWTAALWAVPAKAEIVGLSLADYWQQIIEACFLDYADPVAKWQEISQQQAQVKQRLDEMKIMSLEMMGEDVNLKLTIGPDRIWHGGNGRNIPSFEIFTSPDWRGTQGWYQSNQPVYRYGQEIRQAFFEFKAGRVVQAKAAVGQKLLTTMVASPEADKLGEFSLTDRRWSRITHPMAEILFDENMGGPFGNTHLAIGMAFRDCYAGDPTSLTAADWQEKGFNVTAAEHTDFISTADRQVTATLADGSQVVIYADGQFVI